MSDLKNYKYDLHQEIALYSDVDQSFPEEGFFEKVSNVLSESGAVDNCEYTPFRDSGRGLRIDGYSWNELEKTFCVILVELSESPDEEQSLTQGQLDALIRRASKFITLAVSEKFIASLDVSSPGRGTAEFIRLLDAEIIKFRLIIATDCQLSSRVKNLKIGNILDRPAVLEVWDLERLFQLSISTSDHEEFNVGPELLGSGIQLIKASENGLGEVSYLGVMPGAVLSEIYDTYGQRLLESNVRTFLDFRAGTNKGMRQSLLLEPANFFSYNNGITVTATAVVTEESSGGILLKSVENMQIVNGGQTTASIYFSGREKGSIKTLDGDVYFKDIDLSRVSVQMKLTVLSRDDKDRADLYKANIANYANSQNTVQASDLVSNHPFHLMIEKFSRQALMPVGDGGLATKWFYERARGQYATKLRALNADGKKRFEREFPKRQLFSKTEMAKYENTWRMLPHIVKKGAQANLKAFGSEIHNEYEANPLNFEMSFYKDLIAKMILFREVDKETANSNWYAEERGFKAEAVTFSIALVRKKLIDAGFDLNLEQIYKNQKLSKSCENAFVDAAHLVRDSITDPSFRGGSGNPSEFCKSENGWKRIQALQVDLALFQDSDLLDKNQKKDVEEEKVNLNIDSKFLSDYELALSISATEWMEIAAYNRREYPENHKNVALPTMCARIGRGGKIPSELQLKTAVGIRIRAYQDGFEFAEI